MGYAETLEEESTILIRRIQWHKDDPSIDIKSVLAVDQFLNLQQQVENEIYIDKCILDYVSSIVRATRQHPKVEIGASPRGGLSLLKLSRSLALINGRDYVIPDDIKIFCGDVLAHRLILNIEETLEGVSPRQIVEEIVSKISVPTNFIPR
jgi:MoxR-like ATPase